MVIQSYSDEAIQILKLLGIEVEGQRITKVTIKFTIDDPVIVEIERLLDSEFIQDGVYHHIDTYHLVKKDV